MAEKLSCGGLVAEEVQGDWNVSDENSPNFVKNRPFYEDVKTISELIDINWDGNTEGLVASSKNNYYKVSDYVFTLDQFKQMNYVYNGEDTAVNSQADEGGINKKNGIITLWEGTSAPVLVSQEAVDSGANIQGGFPDTFPEPGVYFYYDGNVSRLYAKEPIEISSTTLKKLDQKFIPSELAEIIIPSSTSGSSKKFKIAVDDTGTISATEVQ